MNEGKMFTFGACGLGTRSRFGRVACVVEKWKMETRKCLSRETVLATQNVKNQVWERYFSNPVDLMHKKLKVTQISVWAIVLWYQAV